MIYTPSNIYLVDAYKAIKDVPSKSIDLIITDPPYEISVNHGGGFIEEKSLNYEQFAEISNGIDWGILDELVRVMKKINLYIWCSKKQIDKLMNKFVTELKCNFDIISWHKSNAVPACGNTYMPDTEYCLFFREKGVPVYGTPETKKTYYVQPINMADKKRFQHPTIKPLNIITNFVTNSMPSGGGAIRSLLWKWYKLCSRQKSWLRVHRFRVQSAVA